MATYKHMQIDRNACETGKPFCVTVGNLRPLYRYFDSHAEALQWCYAHMNRKAGMILDNTTTQRGIK
jgi:hypothetical protein